MNGEIKRENDQDTTGMSRTVATPAFSVLRPQTDDAIASSPRLLIRRRRLKMLNHLTCARDVGTCSPLGILFQRQSPANTPWGKDGVVGERAFPFCLRLHPEGKIRYCGEDFSSIYQNRDCLEAALIHAG